MALSSSIKLARAGLREPDKADRQLPLRGPHRRRHRHEVAKQLADTLGVD